MNLFKCEMTSFACFAICDKDLLACFSNSNYVENFMAMWQKSFVNLVF